MRKKKRRVKILENYLQTKLVAFALFYNDGQGEVRQCAHASSVAYLLLRRVFIKFTVIIQLIFIFNPNTKLMQIFVTFVIRVIRVLDTKRFLSRYFR